MRESCGVGRTRLHRWFAFGCLVAATAGLAMAGTAGATEIHAHRGGANVEGVGTYPENSMSAFRHSLSQGWVLEFDVMSTADGVPVIMHDNTLDRTTDCSGPVGDVTWINLQSACELDRIGIDSAVVNLAVDDPRREPVPRLADVLALLKETGGRANIEVKEPSVAFATQVYHQIAASGVPPRKVIIQNFAKPSLVPVPGILSGAAIALLTLNGSEYYFGTAAQVKANWLSPQWSDMTQVPRDQYVADAHAEGLKVVPWTVDEESDLLAVGASGADAVISNDPTRAQRLIGPPDAALPKLALQIRRTGGATVRPGQSRSFTVTVANTGRVISGPVKLNLAFPKALLRPNGQTQRDLAAVPAESRQIVKFRVRVRAGAKAGRKIRLTFTARDRDRPSGKPVRRTSTLRIAPNRK